MSVEETLRKTHGLLEQRFPNFRKAAEERRRKCNETMEALSRDMKGIFNHSVFEKIAKISCK